MRGGLRLSSICMFIRVYVVVSQLDLSVCFQLRANMLLSASMFCHPYMQRMATVCVVICGVAALVRTGFNAVGKEAAEGKKLQHEGKMQ